MEENKNEQEIIEENIASTAPAEGAEVSIAANGEEAAQSEAEGTETTQESVVEVAEKPLQKAPRKSRKEIKEEKLEARRKEFEGLSDDEIYTKIQTEKLLKSKKNKRIATSITLGVAFVLALCVILLATIPVSLKPSCLSDNFATAKLYTSSSTPVASISKDSEKYQTFKKLYDKSFEQTYLNALFSGSLFSYEIEENTYHDAALSNDKGADTTSLSSVFSYADTSYILQLNYDTEQTLKNQDGSTYTSVYGGTTSWDGVLTFSTAYVVVNTTSGLQDTEIYLVCKYPSTATAGYTMYFVCITVKADTFVLYESWSDLKD